MTRTIFYTATTLDGFLADESDSLDWLFVIPQDQDAFPAFLERVGAIVQGSTTYEWVLDHEDLVAHPEKWPVFYGPRPTWVFTSRALPQVPGADVRFVQGAVREHWRAIRESAGGKDVWVVGGGDLAGQFADAGLLDEVRLSVAPVTLGSGRPLLPRRFESDRLHLESVAQNGQFAELTYRMKKRVASGPERFLTREGSIDRYPSRPEDRRALLEWIIDRAVEYGEILTEVDLNGRLRAWDADVARLRRALVDAGLVERTASGSEYARVAQDPVDNPD